MNAFPSPQNLTTRRLVVELLHEWAVRDIKVNLGMKLVVNAPKGALTQEDQDALESYKDELLQILRTEWLDTQLAQQHDLALWCAPGRAPDSLTTPWLLPHRNVIERALADALPVGSVQSSESVLDDAREAVLDATRLIEAISRITRGRDVPSYFKAILNQQNDILREVHRSCESADRKGS